MSIDYARRVKLAVSIGGHDATGSINPSLLEFSFTDHASGKADEVQITLHDRDGQWNSAALPQRGDSVTASLTALDWFGTGAHATLDCGAFKVDELEFSGPPDKVKIKAVSASLTIELKDTERTKAWENVSLQDIGGEIAGRAGLALEYYGPPHHFDRRDQREASDLSFLHELGESVGMKVKVYDDKIILFDADEADAQGPSLSIAKRGTQFSPRSYSFRLRSADTVYSQCDLSYTDPSTGETWEGEAAGAAPDSKNLHVNVRAENDAQAATLAKAALREKNEKQAEGNVETMGHPGIRAGLCIHLEDFGVFSGKWFVTQAEHRVGGSGYTTSAQLRRTLGEQADA